MTNSEFRLPTYIGELCQHEPQHRIRCAVHGFIRFSDAERNLIDHPLFRRLRYIRQLALTELVYPGATHTRFEHSLGVMEMATRIFDRLASKKGAIMEETFREIPALQEDTMAKSRQICRLAGLLHDIGHCCFSHAAEPILQKGEGHESLTVSVIRGDSYLKHQIDNEFFEGCADLTASLIKNPDPQLQILSEIVSGHVDADRSDYLLRDSHHCGVEYGRFDFRRLIECLTVCRDEELGQLRMAISRDGVHSFESLILARYQMNTQVYYHRLRRIYDRYLEEYFRELGREDATKFDSADKVLALNDFTAMAGLMKAASDADSPGHHWASRIINRTHHRDVFTLDEREGHMALRACKKVETTIKQEFNEVEFLSDFPEKPVSIHKIAGPNDNDEDLVDFPLMEGEVRDSLGRRSQILEKLPPKFRIGYIFADVSDRDKKDEIKKRCREIYRSV